MILIPLALSLTRKASTLQHKDDPGRHRRHKAHEDEEHHDDHIETAFDSHKEAKAMKKRVRRLKQKQQLQNESSSWAFFVIFLAYPAVVDKVFAMFYCFEMDDGHSYLAADFSISCTTMMYKLHRQM